MPSQQVIYILTLLSPHFSLLDGNKHAILYWTQSRSQRSRSRSPNSIRAHRQSRLLEIVLYSPGWEWSSSPPLPHVRFYATLHHLRRTSLRTVCLHLIRAVQRLETHLGGSHPIPSGPLSLSQPQDGLPIREQHPPRQVIIPHLSPISTF
jgi:hypothetical protein